MNQNGKSVLVLNKSNFYTNSTKQLNQLLNEEKENSLIINDIDNNAMLVNKLGQNCEIILFGVTQNKLYHLFMKTLKNEIKDKIINIRHPSYNNLGAELAEYFIKKITNNDSIPSDIIDIFKEISNSKKIN